MKKGKQPKLNKKIREILLKEIRETPNRALRPWEKPFIERASNQLLALIQRERKELLREIIEWAEKQKIGGEPSGWLREQKPAYDGALTDLQKTLKNKLNL